MSHLDERLFREIMTQIKGVKGMQLLTREGVIIDSLFADDFSKLELSTITNAFLTASEHVLVSLRLQDLKIGILQSEDGFFIVSNFEKDCFLIFLIGSNAPINVILSQIQHILGKQVPVWRHDKKNLEKS